ncbi:hypothetical protein [Planotetraspora sp. GP83]|uniref:hypothetical protein n=1 Tax=Planotetraspora sp. GP83 TaxID=3156264 RepID=UPI00351325DE
MTTLGKRPLPRPPITLAAAAALTAVTTLISVTAAGCTGGPATPAAAPAATPSPAAAQTTPAAEPCQEAVGLINARAGAAITLMDLQKSAEWEQAIVPCRADATRHTQVELLPLTIGLAAQRLAEADEAGRLTKEQRQALEAAIELINTGLHGDDDTTS